ncbi:MAG TPA: GGDEF domain-containing protein [Mycobacteriales bacterium]|nr:GGDEF domain-containing protein [Mycobacteriales bacterium]
MEGTRAPGARTGARRARTAAHRPAPWQRLPASARACLIAAHATLLTLTIWSAIHTTWRDRDASVIAGLCACAVANIEWGRRAEHGRVLGQRPHKGLSAWALAAAVLAPVWVVTVVTAFVYAYARQRGLKVTLFKWVGSGTFVALAAIAAENVAEAVSAKDPLRATGPMVLVELTAVLATFVVAEGLLFAAIAWTNDAEDEAWLRAQLRSRSYHSTELAVGCTGLLTATVFDVSPWLLVLFTPTYALLQRALLVEPLRSEARTDAKTGLLTYRAWRDVAEPLIAGCAENSTSATVLLLDLDGFKAVNDDHGHLVGDDVLAAVGEACRAGFRDADVVGRFGGDELCALLPNTTIDRARTIAEDVRTRVQEIAVVVDGHPAPLGVTMSIGGAFLSPSDMEQHLAAAISAADGALYRAKRTGRNRVVVLPLHDGLAAKNAPPNVPAPRLAQPIELRSTKTGA